VIPLHEARLAGDVPGSPDRRGCKAKEEPLEFPGMVSELSPGDLIKGRITYRFK
jgi:hypothetical protein